MPTLWSQSGRAPIEVLEDERSDIGELGLHVVHQLNNGALPEERH